MNLSRRQWMLLVLFFTVNTMCAVIYNLQQPFYPKLCESKNCTATEFSIVFGIYEAAVVVACPLWSVMVYYAGVKQAFVGGVMSMGLSVIFFGFVEKIEERLTFLTISIVIRILEAFSFAATFVGMYTLIPVEFPKNVAIVMSIIQMGQAVGYSLGPPFGGTLYTVGGFFLPFLVIGIINIVLGLLLLPAIWNTPPPAPPTEKHSVFSILKKPVILLNFIMLLGPQCAMAFNYTLLEPFLQHTFHLSPLDVGLVFGLCGVLYAVPLPFWGHIVSKIDPVYAVFIGLLLDIPGNILIGPIPILGLSPNLVRTCIGIALFGAGTGAALIGGLVTASNVASLDTSREVSQTMSLVSGCYMGFFAGAFSIGSPISGLLFDHFGFERASFFSIFILLFSLAMQIFYIWYYKSKISFKGLNITDQVNKDGVSKVI